LGGVRARNISFKAIRCVSRPHRACGASWLAGCGACTGDVTVLGGVHLDLLGTVFGNLLVEDSGTASVRGVVAEAGSTPLGCSGAQTGAAAMAPNRTNLGYTPELESAIEEELSVLGSIEARYTDELARLEQSETSGSTKARLRQQLEWRRKSAREPHVIKLTELRQRLLAETIWRFETKH
jgi:hypothetical protein